MGWRRHAIRSTRSLSAFGITCCTPKQSVFGCAPARLNVSELAVLMSELTALCEQAAFSDVKTYIQSGNVVFRTRLSEAKAQATLERALSQKLGTPAVVVLRTADQLEALIAANPFKREPPNRVMVMFMNDALGQSVADVVSLTAKAPARWQTCLCTTRMAAGADATAA